MVENFEKTIDAKRGSPPAKQTFESYVDYAKYFVFRHIPQVLRDSAVNKGKLNNYGLKKPATQKLKQTLAGLDVGQRENEDVLMYQNTVGVFNEYVNQALTTFDTKKREKYSSETTFDEATYEADKSSLVVIVEDPCYDRVLKDLEKKENAGQLRIIKCPIDYKTGKLDLSVVQGELEENDVPIFYRTPVNNPTGVNTLEQDKEIYHWIHGYEGGSVVSDYAYHFLSGKNSESNPLQAYAEATEYTDVCFAQFSKVLGQNGVSFAVYKNDHDYVKDFVATRENGNFTDPDQAKVGYMDWLLSSPKGRKLLYKYEQMGVEMVQHVRGLIEASDLDVLIAPEDNDGYFELIDVGGSEAEAKETLEKAKIAAEIVEVDGRFGARISYSLDVKVISEVIRRIELTLYERERSL